MAAQIQLYAQEQGQLQVHLEQNVLHCSAMMPLDREVFSHAMADGIAVATEWKVNISRVRDYWPDATVAGITLIRKVDPDLLTRSWMLLDESTGISRRVYSLEEALNFLSNLKGLPVLDSSLLQADERFIITVDVDSHIGVIDQAWWSGMFNSATLTMQKEFSLP